MTFASQKEAYDLYGQDCGFANFWTTIFLMSVSERLATQNENAARDITKSYNKQILTKLQDHTGCTGKLLTAAQMADMTDWFASERAKYIPRSRASATNQLPHN